MALVDVDTWITEHDACERLSHQILTLIAQRNQETKLSEGYSRISANIRIRIKQLSTEIDQLKIKLNISSKSNSITPEELERRERQIENLQTKLQQLQNKFKSVSYNERQALLSSNSSQLWEDDDDDAPIFQQQQNYNVEDLRKQQIQILEHQNEGLEALSRSISRQKTLAARLGTEVGEQNEIIDNIADNMERVDARLNSETQHIGVVNRKDSTCAYWVVIILLFIVICIVALV